VVQASGAMMGIQDDIKKAVSAFVNGLGEKDQVAVVDYAETAEIVAPSRREKGEVAGKARRSPSPAARSCSTTGWPRPSSSMPRRLRGEGRGAHASSAPKAIIVISDGRDNGSATDVEKVNQRREQAAHSHPRRRPLRARPGLVAQSGDDLPAHRRHLSAAPNVDDINKSLTVIKDFVNKMYVIQWKTRLDHDGKDHKVEIAMENEAAAPRSSPPSWCGRRLHRLAHDRIVAAVILLVVVGGIAIYVLTRPRPPPTRFCPVCKRAQMPEWRSASSA